MNTVELLAKYKVTESQLARCHRIEDHQLKQVWYAVESATREGVEYKVIFDRKFGKLRCMPFTGEPCEASLEGTICWHMRAAACHAAEIRLQRIAEQERQMVELAKEMAAEARACPYCGHSEVVDPTSSSLDGVKFEVVNGRPCPMR